MSQLHWRDILGWDERYIEGLRVTAFLYIREGHYHIAQPFCEALAILNPKNSYDQSTLGALYLEQNSLANALLYLEKAKKLDPNDLLIEINRIKTMLQLGYREEGIKLIDEFIVTCDDAFMISDAEALKMAYAQ